MDLEYEASLHLVRQAVVLSFGRCYPTLRTRASTVDRLIRQMTPTQMAHASGLLSEFSDSRALLDERLVGRAARRLIAEAHGVFLRRFRIYIVLSESYNQFVRGCLFGREWLCPWAQWRMYLPSYTTTDDIIYAQLCVRLGAGSESELFPRILGDNATDCVKDTIRAIVDSLPLTMPDGAASGDGRPQPGVEEDWIEMMYAYVYTEIIGWEFSRRGYRRATGE